MVSKKKRFSRKHLYAIWTTTKLYALIVQKFQCYLAYLSIVGPCGPLIINEKGWDIWFRLLLALPNEKL
jgi:hypothetical protein